MPLQWFPPRGNRASLRLKAPNTALEGELRGPLASVWLLFFVQVIGQDVSRIGIADGDTDHRLEVLHWDAQCLMNSIVMNAAHRARREAELVCLQRQRLPSRSGVEGCRPEWREGFGVTLASKDEDQQRGSIGPALIGRQQ